LINRSISVVAIQPPLKAWGLVYKGPRIVPDVKADANIFIQNSLPKTHSP
jgi:hypothetical protein